LGGSLEATPEVLRKAKQKLKLATLVQMTLPGSPTVYYGDEVGLSGGDDPYNRMPYPWADQGGQPDMALRQDFQSLLKLRHDKKVLRRGALTAPLLSTQHVVVLARQWERDFALIAVNNSEQVQTHTFELPAGVRGKEVAVWWGQGEVKRQGSQMTITLPPMSGGVWGTNSASK
jgi:glycosidase